MHTDLGQLDDATRGLVVTSTHDAYDEARRVYNAMIDKNPSAVLHAADVADVMAAVRFAREHDLELAVRGGGHHAAGFGTCDNGLVIDLGGLRGIRVDPRSRTLRAEGGCTFGDVDHAAHGFGLAVPGGLVSTTGIGGLTLGGGIGFLARRYGLACDNLRSADVVTATGEFVTADADTNPDLFWALRGGGGNFGIVTSFEYQAHPVRDIVGGPTFFALDDGHALRHYRDWLAESPNELSAVAVLTLAPDAPFVDEAWWARPVCAVLACWTGDPADADAVLNPIRDFGEVVGQMIGPMPYPAINTLFDDKLPAGLRHYWKGDFVTDLTDEAIKAHANHATLTPTPESAIALFPVDGAVHHVNDDETAFPHRSSRWATVYTATWHDRADDETNIAWLRGYYDALRPWSDQTGSYVNFASADDQDKVPDHYGTNLSHLAEVKATWDPENLFRRNQNVIPTTR